MSEKPNHLNSGELNSSAKKKRRDSSSSNERPDRRQVPDRRGPSQIRSYLENDLVFPENEIGNEAFIIKTGSIEIFKTLYKDGKKVRETVLGILEEGSLFGEMALIEDEKRMAGARAKGEGVSVYVISRTQFKEKLKPINPFIVRFLHVLAASVRRSADKLNEE